MRCGACRAGSDVSADLRRGKAAAKEFKPPSRLLETAALRHDGTQRRKSKGMFFFARQLLSMLPYLRLSEAQQPGMVPSSGTISTVQQSWMVVKADGPHNASRTAMCIFRQELGVANIGEIMYKHLFKIAPVTKSLFPVSVRKRYRDWSCSEEEALSALSCKSRRALGEPNQVNKLGG